MEQATQTDKSGDVRRGGSPGKCFNLNTLFVLNCNLYFLIFAFTYETYCRYFYKQMQFGFLDLIKCRREENTCQSICNDIKTTISNHLENYALFWSVLLPFEEKVTNVSMIAGNETIVKKATTYIRDVSWGSNNDPNRDRKNKRGCCSRFCGWIWGNLCNCCILICSIVGLLVIMYVGVVLSESNDTNANSSSITNNKNVEYVEYPICYDEWPGDMNVIDLVYVLYSVYCTLYIVYCLVILFSFLFFFSFGF